MSTTRKGTRLLFLDRIFDTSLILKGLDGLLELVGGVLLLLVSPKQISSSIMLLTQHELSQDPKDFIATHLVAYAHTLTASVTLFAAAYLLVHGIVKIVLVACTGYLGYPFENRQLEGTASAIAMDDALVFGGVEAVRRTLSLSGTCSWSPRYSLPYGARKRVSVGESETDTRRFRSSIYVFF